jgi:hypothetical protein
MKRTRRRLTAEERRQAAEFKASVEVQPCAVCGTPWVEPDAHHVVSAQELRKRRLPVYDKRNALPLCPIGTTGFRCHERHENGVERIPLECLTDDNLNYASETLGSYAGDYLRAHYSGTIEQQEVGRHRVNGPPRGHKRSELS